jgi:hypothetical protein
MNFFSQYVRIFGMLKIVLIAVIGIIEIPLVIGLYNKNTVGEIIGMVVSVFILQPLAVAVGLGLGIHPAQVMFIMISFGISVILVLPRICDMFAEQSGWLQQNLKKIEAITQKSEMFRKYGIYTFIPFIWVPGVGLYGCVDCVAVQMEECQGRCNHPCRMDSGSTHRSADIYRDFSDSPVKKVLTKKSK